MLYDFGRIFGVEVDTKIQTNAVTVLDTENKGTVNLTTDVGSFYLNGIEVGSITDAVAGDEIYIELTTPSGYVATLFVPVYQDGILVSICSVTTTFDPASEFDPAYIDLEPYEILPESIWEPSDRAYYEQFGTNITHDLFADASNNFTLTRHVICDYHRDQIYFCSPTKGLAKIISNELTKPASSVDYYNSTGLRIAHLVLYRGENTIAVFQDYTRNPDLDIVLDSDAIKIKMHDSTLYVLYKNKTLVLYTMNEDTFSVSEGTVVSENVLDFVSVDGNLAYIERTDSTLNLVDFDDSKVSLISTATTLAYNNILDSFAVGHKSTGALTVIGGAIGNRTSSYDASTGFLYISYIEAHGNHFYAAGEFNGILKFDGSTKIFYPKEDPVQGIADFNNYLLVTYLYGDIDPKINIIDMQPDYYVFDPQLLPGAGSIVRTKDKTVSGLGAPTVLSVPNLTDPEITIILNGEELSVKSVTVTNGDVFSIKVVPATKFERRLDLPIILGSSKRDLTLLPIPGTILPKDTGFGPVVGDIAYEEKSTKARTFPFLEEKDTIYVSVDVGQVIVNNIPMGRNANIGSGDSVSFSNFIPGGRCTTDYQTVTYGEDLFTSVIAYKQSDTDSTTIVGLGAPGTNVTDIWENAVPGSTVRTSESVVKTQGTATFEIPDLYDAVLIKNGMKVGTRSNFIDGDLLQIELTTTAHYNTEHRLSLTSCTSSFAWRVYNSPDLYVDPFDLGTQLDLALSDYVVSEEVVLSGLGYRQTADLVVPYGTILFLNGIKLEIPEELLDYRGVLIEDFVLPNAIVEGDRVRLEGYPRNIYGTMQQIPLRVGYSTGYWSLKTYNVDPFKGNFVQGSNIPVPLSAKQVSSFHSQSVIIDLGKRHVFGKSLPGIHVESSPISVSHFAETPLASNAAEFIPESETSVGLSKLGVEYSSSFEGFVIRPDADVDFNVLGTFENTMALVEAGGTSIVGGKSYSVEPNSNFTSDLSNVLHTSEPHYLSSAVLAEHTPVSETTVDFAGFEHTVLDSHESYLTPELMMEPWTNFGKMTLSTANMLLAEDVWQNPLAVAELAENTKAYAYESIHYTVPTPLSGFELSVFQYLFSSPEFQPDPLAEYVFNGDLFEHTTNVLFFSSTPWETYKSTAFNQTTFEWLPSMETFNPVVYSNWHTPDPEIVPVVYSHWIPEKLDVSPVVTYPWETPESFEFSGWEHRFISNTDQHVPLVESSWLSDSFGFTESEEVVYEVEPAAYVEAEPSKWLRDVAHDYLFVIEDTNAPLNEDEVLPLQHVFETESLALANAESYGLTEIDIHIIPYEDSFIWVQAMPCNNMCGDCPETGYIHGG